tara:strand:- start:252 stop:1385 length:1134 start_codon:yes stop_codon:yes gene_type:complete
MGGKGSQQSPTDVTQRTTSLPEYADPYFRRTLQGAEDAMSPFRNDYSRPIYGPSEPIYDAKNQITGYNRGELTGYDQISNYQPYPGERLTSSNMYGDIGASRAMTRGIAQQGIAGMPEAMQAGRMGMSASGRGIGYTDQAVNRLRGAGQYDPTTFTGGAVQQYMSPYMQNVVDVQKQQARLDFDRSQAGRDADAVSAGAFGGSRRGVVDALAEEGLQRQLGDIQALGQQQAFDQASRQFEADRSDRQFGIGQLLAGEQASLGAANQLGGMGQQFANMGAGLASLGERQRASDIQGAQLLDTVGRDIRAEDQGRLDLSYEDFVRQREYPQQQYERFAGLLKGMPITPNVDVQRMQSYNPLSQALGAGISALGLYKGLT